MSGDAFDTITRFWTTQDAGDYTATVDLFAEDAVFEDPMYGTFRGRAEIGAFMSKMNAAMAERNGSFRAVRISGGERTAWAQWHFTSDAGERDGVGIYEVDGGLITYYRDYMDPAAD